MKRDEAFPSKFLKAADIPDEGQVFTVDYVESEEFKNDGKTEEKRVVYFKGCEKGLVLNKTNGNTMFDLCGEDDDDWGGRKVRLITSVATFNGKTTDCIRVSTKPVKPATRPARPPSDEDGEDDPAPEASAPRSGKALFAWVKDMEQKHEVGVLKYINGWGRLMEFPARIVDWDDDQVAQAHAECVRKLQTISNPVPAGAGEGDDDIPF